MLLCLWLRYVLQLLMWFRDNDLLTSLEMSWFDSERENSLLIFHNAFHRCNCRRLFEIIAVLRLRGCTPVGLGCLKAGSRCFISRIVIGAGHGALTSLTCLLGC